MPKKSLLRNSLSNYDYRLAVTSQAGQPMPQSLVMSCLGTSKGTSKGNSWTLRLRDYVCMLIIMIASSKREELATLSVWILNSKYKGVVKSKYVDIATYLINLA